MRWSYLSYCTEALVADDGEIIDEVTRLFDGSYVVQSTNKKYITEIDAKNAAIRSREQTKPEPKTLSPAEYRSRTNAPWNDKASY